MQNKQKKQTNLRHYKLVYNWFLINFFRRVLRSVSWIFPDIGYCQVSATYIQILNIVSLAPDISRYWKLSGQHQIYPDIGYCLVSTGYIQILDIVRLALDKSRYWILSGSTVYIQILDIVRLALDISRYWIFSVQHQIYPELGYCQVSTSYLDIGYGQVSTRFPDIGYCLVISGYPNLILSDQPSLAFLILDIVRLALDISRYWILSGQHWIYQDIIYCYVSTG